MIKTQRNVWALRALMSLITLGLAASAFAEGYDYFKNIQYPGKRRADVGLDKISQEGGSDAVGYNKRVVTWWPKKGVDIVDVPKGVELRTWTIRTPEIEPLVEVGVFAKWWPEDLRGKKQFKAHLIGFRGIGTAQDIPFWDEGRILAQGRGICPGVILRLEDGRKRCFTKGSFSDADQKYILDLYEKEMARVRKTLEPPPTKIPPDLESRYPIGKLYSPGTFRIQSDRFVISSGSEEAGDGVPGVWINQAREKDSVQHRAATLRMFEDYWAYNEYSGHLMPYWEKPVQYKYSVVYGGTLVNGIEIIGRGNGGGYGGCSTACWEGLYHEWGHGCCSDPMVLLGGGETRCDAMQTMADPSLVRKVTFGINRPYKNFFWGQYPGGFGYTMMGDDPNWGYAAVASFPSLMTETENTPMHAIARLGQERGIWDNGIKGMGDFMGEIGARFAEYDYELEGMLRETYPQPNRAYLVALDRSKGLYRSTRTEAPEPFGCNVVRMTAEPGAKKITVDFRGLYDPDTYGDWRACIVVVGANNRPRYSPLWNKGEMSMDMKEGDRRFWLTVTATPYALAPGMIDGGGRMNHIYQGGFTYKYPYEVQLTGCRPANPNAPIGVNENMELIGPSLMARADANNDNCGQTDWPHPSDTPQYAQMKQTLESLLVKAPQMIDRVMQDGLFTDAMFCPIANRPISRQTALASATFLEWRAKWLLENAQGARHPNGGGWVAKSAKVAPSAYVGPDCMVLDGAQVLDNAIIEDYAMISGPKVLIKDHAKVYGKAVVCGDVILTDYARVFRNIYNRASKVDFNKTAPICNFQMITGVPVKRDAPEERVDVFKNAGLKLEANYAFDRPETILLEDWFQEHSFGMFGFGAHSNDLIFYDGVLYGKPGFVKDGDIRAFTFNGKDQYAEADGAVADLGEITIDISLKWDGGGEQTVFDFGTSKENCFKLTIAPSGELALVMNQGAKIDKITGSKLIETGKWATCRVEIDGQNIRLWLNNEKIAEKASDFRAANVFPAGAEKRNFIAATRDQKQFFKGAIDYLHIYFTVYDDFAAAPEVPMVSSRRIDADFMASFDKKFADYESKEAKYRDDVQKTDMYMFYDAWIKKVDARIAELGNSEEVSKLEQQLKDLQMKLDTRRGELSSEFDKQPENIAKRQKSDDAERKRQDRFRELRNANAECAAAQKSEDDARRLREEIEQAARKSLEAELKALNDKRADVEKRRNAYQDGIMKTDSVIIKNRKEYQSVMDELNKTDPKPTTQRNDQLRERERQLNDEQWRRRDVLLRDDSEWRQFDREFERINQEERAKIDEVAGKDPRYANASADQRKYQQKREDLERGIWSDPVLVALEDERNNFNTNSARDAYVMKGTAGMPAQIGQMQGKIKSLRVDTALANNPDEYQALVSLGWGKDQYKQIIVERLKGEILPLMPEDKNQMRQAAPFQIGKWSTKVDWDGRTSWEKSYAQLSPLMQRWLKRMKPYMYH
ncbi:MAG: DUF6055 domain-containing protein [Armatimonadetes bacterium]|nr:DUF6055 domain-containing protein [Armatimonadota bacterium]